MRGPLNQCSNKLLSMLGLASEYSWNLWYDGKCLTYALEFGIYCRLDDEIFSIPQIDEQSDSFFLILILPFSLTLMMYVLLLFSCF